MLPDEDSQGHGILNSILVDASQYVCDVARPILLHWATFPLALVTIFLWHLQACNCFEKRRWMKCLVADRSNRLLWEAWVVLHIYYSKDRPTWMRDYQFAISSSFIVAETLLLFFIRARVDNADDKRRQASYIQQNARLVTNKYMDFSYKCRRAFLYFFVQCALVCYFVYWLNADVKTKLLENVSMLKWIVAVLLTMTASEQDEAGIAFNIGYWKVLLRRDKDEKVIVSGSDGGCTTWRRQLYLRAFMDCIVNGLNRTLLMALAPVALCVEQNTIDFIKDAVALFFITKLDDNQRRKRLEECMEDVEEQAKRTAELGKGGDSYAGWMKEWRAALREEKQRREAEKKELEEGRGQRADNEREDNGGADNGPGDNGRGDDETTPLNNAAEASGPGSSGRVDNEA